MLDKTLVHERAQSVACCGPFFGACSKVVQVLVLEQPGLHFVSLL